MTSSSKRNGSVTPSMQRGEIDAGLEGDKVAGFDPATVPMETDAEAGGTATMPVEPLPRRGASVKTKPQCDEPRLRYAAPPIR